MCCVVHENKSSLRTNHGSFKRSPATIQVLPHCCKPGTGVMDSVVLPPTKIHSQAEVLTSSTSQLVTLFGNRVSVDVVKIWSYCSKLSP